MSKHVHHDVIVAFANGEPIQKEIRGKWYDCNQRYAPSFGPQASYRIKPKPRTPYQVYMDALNPGAAPHPPALLVPQCVLAWTAVIEAAKAGEFDGN